MAFGKKLILKDANSTQTKLDSQRKKYFEQKYVKKRKDENSNLIPQDATLNDSNLVTTDSTVQQLQIQFDGNPWTIINVSNVML